MIKIGDFGLSRLVTASMHGKANTDVGTFYYKAPEMVKQAGLDNISGYTNKVDVWSAGIMLYELICGRRPFIADTTFELM